MMEHDAMAACPAPEVFWTELPRCEHLVQLYDDDAKLLESLEAFTAGGLQLGEGVVVIATTPHLAALNMRLRVRGLPVASLQMHDQYLPLDADELLGAFMCDGEPDEARFDAIVRGLLARAGANGARRVRAFGEMVALLWQRRQHRATHRLERLWQQRCQTHGLSLLCAYPKQGFAQDDATSIRSICAAHTAVLMT